MTLPDLNLNSLVMDYSCPEMEVEQKCLRDMSFDLGVHASVHTAM
jgi:hypothetical protein